MCGIFGIYSPSPNSDSISNVYSGLFSMQHRGQESCGIAWYDGDLHIKRGKGLLSRTLYDQLPENMPVTSAIGHVRYSTTGGEGHELENVQPMTAYLNQSIALVHNGNISNHAEIKAKMLKDGRLFGSSSDTEIFLHQFAIYGQGSMRKMLRHAFNGLRGAFNLAVLYNNKMIAVRDPWGFRSLFLGKGTHGQYAVASEDVALEQIHFEIIREIKKGEAVIIDEHGVESIMYAENQPLKMCTFEFLYFSRPDCVLGGKSVHSVRKALGRRLAETKPVNADVVVGVPDSGLVTAGGFAETSGIPQEMGLAKNRYVGRSFILPTQHKRNLTVTHKLSPIKDVLRDKSIVLVDDSIVRGTTSRRLVDCLKKGGAREVHMRIASPPIKYSCHYGIDTAERANLIASQMSEDEICQKIGADSLKFIDIQDFADTIGINGTCLACFDGNSLPEDKTLYAL